MSHLHKIIRIVWPLAGLTFMAWLWLSFQARNLPEGLMVSDTAVAMLPFFNQLIPNAKVPVSTRILVYSTCVIGHVRNALAYNGDSCVLHPGKWLVKPL